MTTRNPKKVAFLNLLIKYWGRGGSIRNNIIMIMMVTTMLMRGQ